MDQASGVRKREYQRGRCFAAMLVLAYSVQIAQILSARSALQVIREADKMNIDRDPNRPGSRP